MEVLHVDYRQTACRPSQNTLYCRSAEMRCAQDSSQEYIRTPRINNIKCFLEAKLNNNLFRRSADFECAPRSRPEHIAFKSPIFRRSADFECAPGSSPEHIDFPRIDNIRHYLEAEIVNVYESNGKSTTCL